MLRKHQLKISPTRIDIFIIGLSFKKSLKTAKNQVVLTFVPEVSNRKNKTAAHKEVTRLVDIYYLLINISDKK